VTQSQGASVKPILGSVFDGDICPTNARGWRNSSNSKDPVDFVRYITADFPKVQPRDVLCRIGIRSACQRLSDEHGILNPIELLSRAEVPDWGNSSSGVVDKVVLGEDHVWGNDTGEGHNQFLNGSTSDARAIPQVEQIIVDSRYEFAVGTCKVGYIKYFGNGPSRNEYVVGRASIVLNTKGEPNSG